MGTQSLGAAGCCLRALLGSSCCRLLSRLLHAQATAPREWFHGGSVSLGSSLGRMLCRACTMVSQLLPEPRPAAGGSSPHSSTTHPQRTPAASHRAIMTKDTPPAALFTPRMTAERMRNTAEGMIGWTICSRIGWRRSSVAHLLSEHR